MSKVVLKYGFIFDPASTGWTTVSDFELDISRFFSQKGFRAEGIEAAAGQEDIPLVYLTKSEQPIYSKPVEFSKKDLKSPQTLQKDTNGKPIRGN